MTNEIRRGKRTVRLSNLDKLYWPADGITKGDLLRYYSDVAPTLLPHLRDRPFTMKRYPDGWEAGPSSGRTRPATAPPGSSGRRSR
jgi:bifunctional non-homologous end joining protein LigD